MVEDSVTEVTKRSWGNRLGNSLKGIVVGVVLVCIATGALWWNEGRAVKRAQALDEGAGQVVSVASDRIDAINEGRLIHLTGQASTQEVLTDPLFGVQARAIKMSRRVQMFQWREHRDSKTREKLGGGTETVTTYTYDKGWEKGVIQSADFKKPAGHSNPGSMPYKQWRIQAREVRLGVFQLSPGLISRIDRSMPIPLDRDSGISLPSDNSRLNGNEMYVGANPQSPEIGDIRIRFEAVYPADVSIVSLQRGQGLMPYVAANGKQIELLEYGAQSAQRMFEEAQGRNTILTWIIRACGFIAVFIGIYLFMGTLPVLAAVIPALGKLVGAGVGLLSFILASAVSLVIIAVAWIFYRPLLGIGLLAGAGLMMAGLKWVNKGKVPQPAPPIEAASPPPPPPPPPA